MPTENKLTLKQQRAEQVNQAIRIIGTHGRRFFFNQVADRYASMEVDQRGKVWFIDDYSARRIFTHKTNWGGRWRGFSHGGMAVVTCRSVSRLHPNRRAPAPWLPRP
ncbi:hypothetical protein [Pseudomonas veronii]|uniref:hypothetical protein n=1 Tax=Pseudomonas veronii TaxID=76761 RepID=UPI001EE7310E|nr:hypothetical protein [Pseudomonas veronii]